MKKIVFIFFISILTSILLFFGYNFLFKVNLNDERSAIKIGNKEYFLDVARTDEEKRKGLAKFENIKDNEGMIFIFDTPGRYSFYMKDMKFNIDIVFLDQNKKVVDLFKNVQFKDYKKIKNIFRAHQLVVKNHLNGRGTEVIFSNVKVNNGLSAEDFTQSQLKE